MALRAFSAWLFLYLMRSQGEKVEAQIIKVAKKYAVGRLLKIIEPSSRRVQPACRILSGAGAALLCIWIIQLN